MSELLITYLQKKGGIATAVELASSALNVANPPPAVAARLIEALLKDDDRAQKVADDCWMYRPNRACERSLVDHPLILCAMLPAQARGWREWGAIGFARYNGKGCRILFSGQRGAGWNERRLVILIEKMIRDPLTLFVFNGFGGAVSLFQAAMRELIGEECSESVLSLKKIASRLCGQTPGTEAAMAAALGVRHYEEAGIEQTLEQMAEQLHAVFDLLAARQVATLADLQQFLFNEKTELDFSGYAFTRAVLEQAPMTPGVYIMEDRQGRVIYIGKSKNLRKRLAGYFHPTAELDEKLTAIRHELFHLTWQSAGSELAALLWEQELIRKLDPPVNRQIKVAARLHRQKSRYDRILVLPDADAAAVTLIFLHPHRGLKIFCLRIIKSADDRVADKYPLEQTCLVEDENGVSLLKQELQDFFFTAGTVGAAMENAGLAEIAYSWLSANEDMVNSIDVRKMSRVEDCLRTLLAQAHHVSVSPEKIILR